MSDGRPRLRSPCPRTIADLPAVAPGGRTTRFSEVQRYLRAFGYLTRPRYIPNVLDPATADALRRYQHQNSLPVTGAFDEPTRARMLTPRCAMPDMRNGAAVRGCAWQRRDLRYTFDVGTTAWFDAVRAAFATWSAATPVRFTEVDGARDADIRIGWWPAADDDLITVGGTPAHADFPPGSSIVAGTGPRPVHFDDALHSWSIGAVPGSFDVETVALHQIGHVLGLGHSTVAGSVMFPVLRSNVAARVLTGDDLAAVHRLYRRCGAAPSTSCSSSTATAGRSTSARARATHPAGPRRGAEDRALFARSDVGPATDGQALPSHGCRTSPPRN